MGGRQIPADPSLLQMGEPFGVSALPLGRGSEAMLRGVSVLSVCLHMCGHRFPGSWHVGSRDCAVLSLTGSHMLHFWPWPRVYLLYHTWSQVLYGGIAGGLMAIAWFIFTQEVLTPLFPRIAAW